MAGRKTLGIVGGRSPIPSPLANGGQADRLARGRREEPLTAGDSRRARVYDSLLKLTKVDKSPGWSELKT